MASTGDDRYGGDGRLPSRHTLPPPVASISLPVHRVPRGWRAAQGVGVTLTLALLIALVTRPTAALHVLWDMAVPLLPATFLVNPLLWRSVCPLATLNALTGTRVGRRELDVRPARGAWVAGVALLALLVPARRFLLNANGPALAATIAAVAVLAVGAGLAFSRRAGVCNALCPVLPVEKLYGQAPLLSMRGVRCTDCSVCTRIGCIDLAGTKTVAQTLGPARRGDEWVTTTFGVFAAAFPGFVVAYFTLPDGGLATAPAVYAHVAGNALASYTLVAVATLAFGAGAATILPMLGGAAFVLYYGFAALGLARAYGAGAAGVVAVRSIALALAVVWLWRALRRRPTARPAAAA